MKKGKLIWGLVYVIVFITSAIIFAPVITKFTTGDGGVSKVKWDDTVGTIQKDYKYGDEESQKFDLYLPADSSKNAYGLVVYIHGGGFTGGDKEGDAPVLKWATSKGYVAAGINYTVNSKDDPNSTVYNMSTEIKRGVKAAVEKAEVLGYHINKMTIGGGSAGSMLSMIYAFRDAKESPVPVVFTFQAAGPTLADPRGFGVTTEFESKEGSEAAIDFFNNFVGVGVSKDELKDEDDIKNKITPVSPALLVNKDSVPILFAHGKVDRIVPFAEAEHLLEALQKNNVLYDFIEFEKSGHNLGWQPKKMTQFMDKLSEYLDKYMPLVI
ncbi:Acetyl esterase/lipase [Paenibacillus sp. CF095]|uniref:alpha/beta hydrolase family protein n=1 Tax=Paenibacillus sp. CF095 TaxID=1881033 RepID=UPI00087E4DC1|nr:alpha/beta hydrolase [Paenibacillus sp. CF095]SDD54443.1 Acetyl esterase/lipase [Paenibacillus sp. CF095]